MSGKWFERILSEHGMRAGWKLSIIFRAEDLEYLTKLVHTEGEVPHINHEVGVSDLCEEGQLFVSHVWFRKSHPLGHAKLMIRISLNANSNRKQYG